MNRPARLLALVLLATFSLPALAQSEEEPETRLGVDAVHALREQLASNVSIEEEIRAGILKHYDEAIAALEASAIDQTEAAGFLRDQAGVARIEKKLRDELDRPEDRPHVSLPENTTPEQAEGTLARERAHLEASLKSLREIERLVDERAAMRNEISRRLGELDQQMDQMVDKLTDAVQADTHPELKRAVRTSLRARKQKAVSETDELRARLSLLDARSSLIPLQVDKAQRRVAASEHRLDLLDQATRQVRRRAAAASLERIRELGREAGGKSAVIDPIADETERLAEMLWSHEGVVISSETVAKGLIDTRRYRTQLDRVVEQTRRKFEAYGYRGSIKRWWPQIPDDFPKPGDVAADLREIHTTIPEVQHQLIYLEEQRSTSRALERKVLEDLAAEEQQGGAEGLERIAHVLLSERRDLLDELILLYGRYSNQLVELETVLRYFLEDSEQIQSFLYEQLLWSRSVPRPVIPRVTDLLAGAGWLLSPSSWTGLFGTLAAGFTPRAVVGLSGLVVLVLVRRPVRRRMATLAARAGEGARRDLPGALLYTCVLAAPLPLALFLAGQALVAHHASSFLFAAGSALFYVASVAGLFGLTRAVLGRDGLARAHFGWPVPMVRPIHQGLFWPGTAFLILIYVSLHLGFAGMRLTSPLQLQTYNNSLGRVAFIAAMVMLGLVLLELFRPGRLRSTAEQDGANTFTPTRSAGVCTVVVLITFLPATLATLGYYITGMLLAYEFLYTAWLAIGAAVLVGSIAHWRKGSLTRRDLENEVDAPRAAAAEAQTQKLLRFAVILVTAIGLYTIWSGAFPALGITKRIQVWPRIEMLAPSAPDGLILTTPSARDAGAAEADSGAPAEGAVQLPGVDFLPGGSDVTPAAAASEPLTLWRLMQFLLAAVVTWVLAKNLPGAVEAILSRRGMDSGARVALGTLVRYAVTILGVSVSFGLLGISWSKIQWLAAALTFGLGFGLQEIVANFVSGLILLLERPARINDAVSIGELQGRVTRIQIRATTITLWDRSEMIVPNKEFITQKLVNWTLSDAKRRIDVPLRVAYGANLESVKETLLAVAREHPTIYRDPPPQALLLEFGNDAIRFELRCFVDFGQGLVTKDELHMAIDRKFRENGIDFALPRLNIQMPRRDRP